MHAQAFDLNFKKLIRAPLKSACQKETSRKCRTAVIFESWIVSLFRMLEPLGPSSSRHMYALDLGQVIKSNPRSRFYSKKLKNLTTMPCLHHDELKSPQRFKQVWSTEYHWYLLSTRWKENSISAFTALLWFHFVANYS